MSDESKAEERRLVESYWEAEAARIDAGMRPGEHDAGMRPGEHDAGRRWAAVPHAAQMRILQFNDAQISEAVDAGRARLRAQTIDSPVTLRRLCELAVAVLARPLGDDGGAMAAWRQAAQAADAETVRRFSALSDPERRRVARGDEPVYTLAGGDRPAGWSAPTPAEALRRDLGIPHPSEPGDAPTLRQLINLKAAGWRALDGDNNPPELHAYLAALAAAPNELVAQIGQLPASTCWSIAQEAEGHPVWAAAERAVQKAGALRWQEPAAPDDLAAYVNDLSTVGDSPLRAVLPELVSVPIGVLKHPAPDPLAAALADPDAAAHAAIDAEERLHQAANRLRKSAAATASLLKPLSGEARARLLTEAICTYGADAIEDAMGEGVTLRREVAVEGGERACPCRGCALQREGRGR